MIIRHSLSEANHYVQALKKEYDRSFGEKSFSTKSLEYLAFCITAIIITGTLCWYKFERATAGKWTPALLSWWLHHCKKIPWDKIFFASVKLILNNYSVIEGHLVVDDFDRHRSKITKAIYGVHKTRNKNGGGFVQAQNIVLLVLVTNVITLPVGFTFYRPDPERKKWDKEDEKLRKKGVKKSDRPSKPIHSKEFPAKKTIAVSLIHQFKFYNKNVKIKSISADSAYLSKYTRKMINVAYQKVQFLSQLKANQLVTCPHRGHVTLQEYFGSKVEKKLEINLRGDIKKITYVGARLFINAQNKLMHVVALKYEGEEKYRFICATQPTWRSEDIIRAYAFRWLVEVVIEDFKLYEGWGKEASQQREDGANRGLCLGFLVDHCLLYHPLQRNLHQTGKPLYTVGAMRSQLQFENIIQTMEAIIESPDPKAELKELATHMENVLIFRRSKKHMSSREMPDTRASPSLLKKFSAGS